MAEAITDWFRVEATSEIEAPQAQVWAVLTDIARYGEWNPYVTGVDSTLEVGSPAVLTVQQGDRQMTVPEEIHENDGAGVLAWKYAAETPSWAIYAVRYQVLTPLGPARTRYHTYEDFRGVLAPLVMLTQRGRVQNGFDATAQALKQRAERLHRGDTA